MIEKDNIKDSGVLEQYLLGELEATDMVSVDVILQNDEVLRKYFDELEKKFEMVGLENEIQPPAHVKDQIFNSIGDVNQNKSKSNPWLLGIAASMALFALVTALFIYSQLQDVKQDFRLVEEKNKELIKDNSELSNAYNEVTNWLNDINNLDIDRYQLTGNDMSPSSKLVAYLNHTEKKVIINTEGLQQLETSQDYQMWADVDGEMISMGVIDVTQKLHTLDYIEDAESLNITIEPKGGSDHPTVSNLISNVYITP